VTRTITNGRAVYWSRVSACITWPRYPFKHFISRVNKSLIVLRREDTRSLVSCFTNNNNISQQLSANTTIYVLGQFKKCLYRFLYLFTIPSNAIIRFFRFFSFASLCAKSNIHLPMSLQPNGVNLKNFKLRL